jgi:hypothetical protein
MTVRIRLMPYGCYEIVYVSGVHLNIRFGESVLGDWMGVEGTDMDTGNKVRPFVGKGPHKSIKAIRCHESHLALTP